MKEITINCTEINSRYQLHEKLAKLLDFPEWYGRNLDALYDLLTEIPTDVLITITHFSELENNLGHYAVLVKKVISDAAKENTKIHFDVI